MMLQGLTPLGCNVWHEQYMAFVCTPVCECYGVGVIAGSLRSATCYTAHTTLCIWELGALSPPPPFLTPAILAMFCSTCHRGMAM